MNIFRIGKSGMMNKMELLIPLILFIHREFILWNKRNEFSKNFHFCFIPKMEYMELFWNGIHCNW